MGMGMGTLESRQQAGGETGRAAVVWVDAARAVVARAAPSGPGEIIEHASSDPCPDVWPCYVARIAHELAGCDRVFVSGAADMRLELEREFVALYGRPERLIDLDMPVEPDGDAMLARLAELRRA
jgi:hypothetical protein